MIYKSVEEFLPDPPEMRKYWERLDRFGPLGYVYQHTQIPLRVIITMPEQGFIQDFNGEEWVHVSVSHEHRLPSYEEMKEVKRCFIGDHREAYSIWPKLRVHVNVASKALHLWHRADKDPIPTFGEQGLI